jgi:hypothetical protein
VTVSTFKDITANGDVCEKPTLLMGHSVYEIIPYFIATGGSVKSVILVT